MASLFGKGAPQKPVSMRQSLEGKYHSSRTNLLLIVAFSLINVIMLATGSGSYFLFSAYIPYATVLFGMLFCGKLPAEYYTEDWASATFLDDSFFAVMIAIAAVFVGLYLLAWFLSKKRVGWLVFALVFFALDTAAMLWMQGISADSILDIVFHAWVIFSLVGGIRAHAALKKLPKEEPVADEPRSVVPEQPVITEPTLNSDVNNGYKLN